EVCICHHSIGAAQVATVRQRAGCTCVCSCLRRNCRVGYHRQVCTRAGIVGWTTELCSGPCAAAHGGRNARLNRLPKGGGGRDNHDQEFFHSCDVRKRKSSDLQCGETKIQRQQLK